MSGKYSTLSSLGWDPFFEEQVPPKSLFKPARVVGEERGLYRMRFSWEESECWGELPGKWRFDAKNRLDYPAVGDWVLCEPKITSGRSPITQLLKRKSCLVRKTAGTRPDPQILATNVDTVFLLTSLNDELNYRRIERYLAMIWDSKATPLIVLTKPDLGTKQLDSVLEEIAKIGPGVECLVTSPKTGDGLEKLSRHLVAGKTTVLIGSSGVGKSTLANRLLGAGELKTRGIREKDSKGRHTTSSRNLLLLQSGALLIDTPGIRELQLVDSEEGLEDAFSDIELLSQSCKFSDCHHDKEPHCAVKEAIEKSSLTKERLNNFRKIRKKEER